MGMGRGRRRVIEATLVAAAFSGLPSTLYTAIRRRSPRSAAAYVYDATCAVGTLVPPGRRGFGRGVAVHLAISWLCGVMLARTLPRDHSAEWGAAAGLAIGVVNVGVIGRSFPAIRGLPLVPQLADNMMFAAVFAVALDRRGRQHMHPSALALPLTHTSTRLADEERDRRPGLTDVIRRGPRAAGRRARRRWGFAEPGSGGCSAGSTGGPGRWSDRPSLRGSSSTR